MRNQKTKKSEGIDRATILYHEWGTYGGEDLLF